MNTNQKIEKTIDDILSEPLDEAFQGQVTLEERLEIDAWLSEQIEYNPVNPN